MKPKIAILAIGSELTSGLEADINSYFLSRELFNHGFIVSTHLSVADKLNDIVMAIKQLAQSYQAVIITGGIGPTEDDLTRQAVSIAVSKKLILDDEIYNVLIKRTEAKFAKKMASFPTGSQIIRPKRGVVGGFYLDYLSSIIISLPGVPEEVESIFHPSILPLLKSRLEKKAHFKRKLYKIADLIEIDIEKKLSLINAKFDYGLLPKFGEVHLYITVKDDNLQKAQNLLTDIDVQVDKIFKDNIFAHTDENLEDYVVKTLLANKLTLSVAESSTGGMLGEIITSVSGASEVFVGGYIVYINDLKEKLGVSRDLLEKYGAVSEEVAVSMAESSIESSSSDFSVAITGIAGPEGGSNQKPVGLHYIAIANKNGATLVEKYVFTGTRKQIRSHATQSALLFTRKALKKYSAL